MGGGRGWGGGGSWGGAGVEGGGQGWGPPSLGSHPRWRTPRRLAWSSQCPPTMAFCLQLGAVELDGAGGTRADVLPLSAAEPISRNATWTTARSAAPSALMSDKVSSRTPPHPLAHAPSLAPRPLAPHPVSSLALGLSWQQFHEAAYLSGCGRDLLTAISAFLDCSVVLPPSGGVPGGAAALGCSLPAPDAPGGRSRARLLPPGAWGWSPSRLRIRVRGKYEPGGWVGAAWVGHKASGGQVGRREQGRRALTQARCSAPADGKRWPRAVEDDPLRRTGRPFGADPGVRRRYYYLS